MNNFFFFDRLLLDEHYDATVAENGFSQCSLLADKTGTFELMFETYSREI